MINARMPDDDSTIHAMKRRHGRAGSPGHQIVIGVVTAGVAYGVMLAARPVLHPPVRATAAFIGNAAANLVPVSVHCSVRPTVQSTDGLDLTLLATNSDRGVQASLPVSSELLLTIPLFIVLALAVATPVRWRERGFTALAGAALMLLVAGVRFWIAAATLAYSPALTGDAGTPWVHSALSVLDDLLVESPSAAYVPPFLVWAAVVLMSRRSPRADGIRSTRGRAVRGS